MAKVKRHTSVSSSVRRVSPLKPSLRGARNWANAQVRAASYSRRSFWRLILSLFLGFIALILFGLWLGGFMPDARRMSDEFTRSRLMAAGFVVKHVDVMGEGRMREDDVRRALGVRPGDFLFDLDVKSAQNRVEALNWVDHAVVRRLWPNRISVYLVERKPYALWQNEGVIRVVDASGEAISLPGETLNLEDYKTLKLIVGRDAPKFINGLEVELADFPDIQSRLNALVRLETQRWDLVMNDGMLRVKLPRENSHAALRHVMQLQNTSQILDRDLSIIDLRIADRITLRPSAKEPV